MEAPLRNPALRPPSASVLSLLAALLLAPPAAADPPLPYTGADRHLGAASCASAPCHGGAGPRAGSIRRDEHTVWMRHDPHARAFRSLLSERSRRIAGHLGLGAPERAPECLGCHADAVAEAARGERFSLEEGVGCEACHGGSERWIEPHVSGTRSRAELVALGLYPLDDSRARAELCLSCHFGSGRRFVDHRLHGAGHPRLSFELDTFSQLQPAHHVVDADWTARGKQPSEPARTWAVGQAVNVRKVLEGLADPARSSDGIWPEFAFFDCHACHHPMDPPRWAPRPSGAATRPGVPRLDDSSFLMLARALDAVDPERAAALREGLLALHTALSRGIGSRELALARLREVVDAALPRLAAWQPDAGELRAIALRVVAEGIGDEYRDYAGAEQATMALQALSASLARQRSIEGEAVARLDAALEGLLAATRDADAFRPAAFAKALARVRESLQ